MFAHLMKHVRSLPVLTAIFLAFAASAAAAEARVKVALLDGAPVYHWRVFTSRYSDDLDRALVLREFKRQGFTLPNHFVDEAVQREISEKYQGSNTSFGAGSSTVRCFASRLQGVRGRGDYIKGFPH
jgi:hypothetical protein